MLQPRLRIREGEGRETVSLPTGYFTQRSLTNQPFWNLVTRHGDIDICFEPGGFAGGYEQLRPQATVTKVAGTSVALPVASLADVEHSKRTVDRQKDRDYFEAFGAATAPRTSAELEEVQRLRGACYPQTPRPGGPGGAQSERPAGGASPLRYLHVGPWAGSCALRPPDASRVVNTPVQRGFRDTVVVYPGSGTLWDA